MGSRRNILIAEKLLGWKIYKTTEQWMDDGFKTNGKVAVQDQTPSAIEIPDYDSNISDAWKVYAWLEKRGIVRISNGDGDSKDVDFIPTNKEMKTAHVSARTYPAAICNAALIAMGLEP